MVLGFHGIHLPWRFLQILINAGTIVLGFCTFMPLGYVSRYFSWQCVLYTDIRLSFVNTTTLFVDTETTVWGTSTQCQFATFGPLMAAVHAFVWCWYFLLMKAQLKAENREFPLLVASFFFHSIMCIVVFVASSMISAGVDNWCHSLVKALQLCHASMSCAETQDLFWPNTYIDGKKHPIYSFLLTAKVSSWLQTLTVLGQSIACGYKLYEWILGTTDGQLDLRNCGKMSLSGGSQNGGYDSDCDELQGSLEESRQYPVEVEIHSAVLRSSQTER